MEDEKRDLEEEKMLAILTGPEMKKRAESEVVKRLNATREALDKCQADLVASEELCAHYRWLLRQAGVPVTHERPTFVYPEDGDRSGMRPQLSAVDLIAALERDVADLRAQLAGRIVS